MHRKRYLGAYTKGHGKKRRVIPITASKHKRRMSVASNLNPPKLESESKFNKQLNQDLKKDIPEEQHDSAKYRNQSIEAKKAGRFEDAKELEGISHQEAEHGKKDEHMLNYPDLPNKSDARPLVYQTSIGHYGGQIVRLPEENLPAFKAQFPKGTFPKNVQIKNVADTYTPQGREYYHKRFPNSEKMAVITFASGSKGERHLEENIEMPRSE